MDESAIFLGIHPLGWNGGKDPGTIDVNSFLCVLSPAINGYVMDTLPGLVMAQHQRIRWYLLSMGSNENIHSIHFSGHVFTVRKTEEYKMAVYNLYPGTNQFVLCLQLPVLAEELLSRSRPWGYVPLTKQGDHKELSKQT